MTRGRIANIPDEYAELVLIPATLHISPMEFMNYPPALQIKIRHLLMHYLASSGGLHGSG